MKTRAFEFYYCKGRDVIISREDILKHFQEDKKGYEFLVDIYYPLNGITIQFLSKELMKYIN